MTSPRPGQGPKTPTSPRQSLSMSGEKVYQQERSTGDPLFVSHFGGLSLQPTLGRVDGATAGAHGGKASVGVVPIVAGEARKWGLIRKHSGAGLSESES